MKEILVAAAARKLEASPDQVECAGETFCVGSGAQTALPFAEVVAAALVDEGAITVKGSFTCPPESQGGKHRGGAVGSTMGFSYAAQVVEVSVDDATGLVTIDKVWAALDCGHAINPLAVVGQIAGRGVDGHGPGAVRGNPLSRRPRRPCELSRISHADHRRNRLPIEVQIVESHDPFGPFGAKEASEGALAGFPPAMVNAIANAIGIELDELPVTPDRVVDALVQRRREARRANPARAAIMNDALHALRLVQPGTVDEAIAALLAHPGGRLVAGGTDLLVNMRRGVEQPELLIDLVRNRRDQATDLRRRRLTIGAGVTSRRSPATP